MCIRDSVDTSRYEGPTGIVGVIQDACRKEGMKTISFWAAVPHYVSLTPSPRAALALCERVDQLLETNLDLEELEQAVDSYTESVSEAVAGDEETCLLSTSDAADDLTRVDLGGRCIITKT